MLCTVLMRDAMYATNAKSHCKHVLTQYVKYQSKQTCSMLIQSINVKTQYYKQMQCTSVNCQYKTDAMH